MVPHIGRFKIANHKEWFFFKKPPKNHTIIKNSIFFNQQNWIFYNQILCHVVKVLSFHSRLEHMVLYGSERVNEPWLKNMYFGTNDGSLMIPLLTLRINSNHSYQIVVPFNFLTLNLQLRSIIRHWCFHLWWKACNLNNSWFFVRDSNLIQLHDIGCVTIMSSLTIPWFDTEVSFVRICVSAVNLHMLLHFIIISLVYITTCRLTV